VQKAGVKFVAADMLEANEMVVSIMAQRRRISECTKAALAAAKGRGKRLGSPPGHKVPLRRGRAARQPMRPALVSTPSVRPGSRRTGRYVVLHASSIAAAMRRLVKQVEPARSSTGIVT
jgi:hypothetical protein